MCITSGRPSLRVAHRQDAARGLDHNINRRGLWSVWSVAIEGPAACRVVGIKVPHVVHVNKGPPMTATDFTAAPLLDVPPAGQATPAPVRSPVVRADAEQWDMRSTIT